VEAQIADGSWKRVTDDMGFPAGGPRTMTADLTGKLPKRTQKIRITTNLQVYWDSILINRTPQLASRMQTPRLTQIPLLRADLEFHGYPYKIEGLPPGNVHYIYEKTSATGPYTRPQGTYTRYGDVLPLLTATDDKLAVFGSGDEVRLDFDPSKLPALPSGWVRDYFFAANGYEKTWTLRRRRQLRSSTAVPQHGRVSLHSEEILPPRRRARELPARIQHAPHVGQRAARILVRLRRAKMTKWGQPPSAVRRARPASACR
jgi:hypothetical protein